MDQIEFHSVSQVDGFGRTVGRFFLVGNQQLGLEGEAFKEAEDLATKISERPELRDTISKKFVLDTFFEWAFRCHTKQVHLDNFMAALSVAASRLVRARIIAIPIDHLTIDERVRIGRVSFGVLGPGLFDKAIETLRSASEDPRHRPPEHALTDLRRKYQGFTFALVRVTAEPERAVEIAIEVVDDALLALRFYSPAGVVFESPCYLGRRGRVLIPSVCYVELSEDIENIVQIVDGFDEPRDVHVTFNEEHLSIVNRGFTAVCAVVAKPRQGRTAIEERLLRAIEIFNSGMQAPSLSDRIVADLAAMETLFLRDENEPIQSSLSRRVAFVIRGELEERKSVIQSIKRGYVLRSRYLHHGLSADQADVLAAVHRIAWEGLNTVAMNAFRCADPTPFLEQIDDRMLSAR